MWGPGSRAFAPFAIFRIAGSGETSVPAPEDSWKEPRFEAWLTAPPLYSLAKGSWSLVFPEDPGALQATLQHPRPHQEVPLRSS